MAGFQDDWVAPADATPTPAPQAATGADDWIAPEAPATSAAAPADDWVAPAVAPNEELQPGPIVGEPSAVSSFRQELTGDNGVKDRGTILPLGRNAQTGKVELAAPEMLRSLARGAMDIYEAPFGSPEALKQPQTRADVVNAGMMLTPHAPGVTPGAEADLAATARRPTGPDDIGKGPSYGPKPPGPDDWVPAGDATAGPNPDLRALLTKPLKIRPDVTDIDEDGNVVRTPAQQQTPPAQLPVPKPANIAEDTLQNIAEGKPASAPVTEPTPEAAPAFTTTPGAIAAEHQAEVSRLEAEGTANAAKKIVPTPDEMQQARSQVNTAPSEAQKESGNYQKGHVNIQGLPITIENPIGSERTGVGPEGPWSVTMPADYGYIKRTTGADNEHVDAYVGPNPASGKVFVVDQNDAGTGAFDEHKAFIGFDNSGDVMRTYLGAFSDGKGALRLGALHEMPIEDFKARLKSGDWDKPLMPPNEQPPSPPPLASGETPNVTSIPEGNEQAVTMAKPQGGGEGGVGGNGNEPPGEPPVEPPVEGETPDDYVPPEDPHSLFTWIRGQEDELTRIRGQNEADRAEAKNYVKALPDALKDPITNERLYNNAEDPNGTVLTPEEQALADQYLTPIRNEANEIFNRLNAKGVKVGMDGYIHRIVKGKGTMYDPEEGPPAADAFIGGRGLGQKTSSMNSRRMWKAKWEDGTESIVNGEYEPGKTYSAPDGRKFTAAPATTKEIEEGSNVRYYKNAIANSLDNMLRLRRVERNINYLEGLKSDPTFFSLAQPMGSQMRPPLNWKGTALPQLRGWVMEPRIAKMLDNFYEVGPQNDIGRYLAMANRGLTSAIFVNPVSALVGHGGNVAAHWFVGRGWDNFLPQRWARSSVNAMRAFNDVWKQTPRYQQMLREGNSLMSAPVENQDFHKTMIKLMGGEIAKQPKEWAQIAKEAGTTPAAIYKAIGRVSSRGLWFANDVFMLQRVYDLMDRGYDTRGAIAEAEHEIPNYRIPSEAWDSAAGRAFSDVMRNPNVFIFSRYRYGLIHAYARTLGQLAGKGASSAARVNAAGQLLALGVLFGVLYPIGDKIVQTVFHNKNANVRRSGPATVLAAMKGWLKGPAKGDAADDAKNLYSGISGLFGFAPGSAAIGQALANRDFFTGKHIYNPEGKPSEVAGELGLYGAQLPYPVQQAVELAEKRKTRFEIEESWMGINDPTPKEVALQKHYAGIDYKADKRAFENKVRALKKGVGNMYHSVFGGQ